MTVTCQSNDSFVCLQLREEVYGELANVDQVAGVKVCVRACVHVCVCV